MILCDLDDLKIVNDTLGHQNGDRLLKACADLIKASIRRERDIVARFGGDEFVTILPETDAATCKKIVGRIRSNIERYNEKNKIIPLSISIGFATAQDQSKSLAQVLKEADEKCIWKSKW